MELPFLRRTWIEIDLDKLIRNYQTACTLTKSVVTCVVKSNAYGHGAVRVSQALQEAGCSSFAVSCAREALELRKNGITGEILVMGLTEPEILERCIREGITLTAASFDDLRNADIAAAAAGKAAVIHLKADTGFHRLGFDCTDSTAVSIADLVKKLSNIKVLGLYSHLGLIDTAHDIAQHEKLIAMQESLAEHGLPLRDIHLCDSIGLVRYPDWHGSRIRAGAFLYGVRPSRSDHLPFECLETMTVYTTVSQVRLVKAGDPIGYTDDMLPDHDVMIATLCAGYGDGYPRSLSNGQGHVLIHGKKAPVFGVICMDQMMVDVSDIPGVVPGDTATLLGGGLSYMECADMAHTNRNECITIMSRRPLRVYRQRGQIVTVIDSLLEERRDIHEAE